MSNCAVYVDFEGARLHLSEYIKTMNRLSGVYNSPEFIQKLANKLYSMFELEKSITFYVEISQFEAERYVNCKHVMVRLEIDDEIIKEMQKIGVKLEDIDDIMFELRKTGKRYELIVMIRIDVMDDYDTEICIHLPTKNSVIYYLEKLLLRHSNQQIKYDVIPDEYHEFYGVEKLQKFVENYL